MSEANIRALLRSRKFETLPAPAAFDAGVGRETSRVVSPDTRPDGMSDLEAEVLGRKAPPPQYQKRQGANEGAVEAAGQDMIVRFRKAAEAVKSGKAKGDPLSPLAEHVRLVARNAADSTDGTPTVMADVAAALMSVDDSTRDMILRRAGNPEVFEPLRNSALPEPDAEGAIQRDLAEARASGRVKAEDAAAETAGSVDTFPMIKRWSSHFAQPDKLNKKGDLTESTKSYNRYNETKPKNNNPMDVVGEGTRTKMLREAGYSDADIKGMSAEQRQIATLKTMGYDDDAIAEMSPGARQKADPISAQSSQDIALRYMAGDQLGQLRKIQDARLRDMGYDDATIAQMANAPRRGQEPVPGKPYKDALSPFGEGVQIGGPRTPYSLDIGTDPNYWKPADRKNRTDDRSGATTADVVDRRNKGSQDRVLELLYKLTAPETAYDSQGAERMVSAPGAVGGTATIDLDRYFPWWRTRFADMDASGNPSYPARLPSAEFITGLIEANYGVRDPKFFERVLPLIQRSIDSAPDSPNEMVGAFDGARSAADYANMVVLPSPQFMDVMSEGVGSKDMPYDIYGSRAVPRPEVTAPERHPFQGTGAESNEAQDALNEFRRLMSEPSQPDLGDQASIYRLPQQSPMRALLA